MEIGKVWIYGETFTVYESEYILGWYDAVDETEEVVACARTVEELMFVTADQVAEEQMQVDLLIEELFA